MLSKCKKVVYKCKQKLCGFREDKKCNKRKLLIHEFQETLLKVICKKTKLIQKSILIMDRGLYYDPRESIASLLAERIWGLEGGGGFT